MILWRAANEHESRQAGVSAVAMHAAVSAAIVNTIAGKDTPKFQEMVESWMSPNENGSRSSEDDVMANAEALTSFGPDAFGYNPAPSMEDT